MSVLEQRNTERMGWISPQCERDKNEDIFECEAQTRNISGERQTWANRSTESIGESNAALFNGDGRGDDGISMLVRGGDADAATWLRFRLGDGEELSSDDFFDRRNDRRRPLPRPILIRGCGT